MFKKIINVWLIDIFFKNAEQNWTEPSLFDTTW